MITPENEGCFIPAPLSVCPVCNLCGSLDAIFHPDDPEGSGEGILEKYR